MQSFSDVSMEQDRWVLETVFSGRQTPGYFIDAGAADGIYASNTYALERAGWDGVCIEPNVAFFSRLWRNRSCRCLPYAVSDYDGGAAFVNAGYTGKLLATAEKYAPLEGSVLDCPNLASDCGAPTTVRDVPVMRLDTLLDEIKAPAVIDYMSLDVEGNELEVLTAFPWRTRTLLAISVENYYIVDGQRVDALHRASVMELLGGQGYLHAKACGVDDFFLHPSIASRIALAA